MAVLTPEQIDKLSNLLGKAFTQVELAPVVLVALKAPLANLVNASQPFQGIVFDLVNWVDRRSRPSVIALLQGVVTARAGDTEIWAFCENAFPGEVQRLDSGVLVDRVNRGIEALVALKDLRIVQQTVGQFGADFETASKQIQILKKYKSLHEGLHQLQLKMDTIENVIEDAETDQRAARSLAKHAIELAPLTKKARQQAQGLPGAQNQIAWINEFDAHIATMKLASTQALSSNELRDLADGLNRLLLKLPEISTLLATVASTLPLGNLVKAMTNMAKHIPGTADPQDETSQQITGDLTALGLLKPQLDDLVKQHFEWQWIDNEVAGAAKLFYDKRGPAAKMPKQKWPEFRARFMQVCEEHPQDGWAKELKDHLKLWEKSPLSSPPTKDEIDASESAFDEFHSACSARFFQVDDELNTLCGQLTELAMPLNTLVAVIKRS